MTVKTCRVHGPLNEDQCYVHKHGARKGRSARIELECRQCVISRMGSKEYAEKRRIRVREKYGTDLSFREKKLQSEADRYRRNEERIKGNVRRWRDALRIEVMSHYSGGPPRCAKCPVSEVRFLCLDHVNEDGAEHRRKDPSARFPLLWAKRHGFPPIFQVLCHNCNMRKHRRTNRGTSASARGLLKLKTEVMSHYAGGTPACALCDEGDLDVLTMDHVNGGGNEHRRQLGSVTTWTLYRWLRKNGFPPGFRVLCFNHNLGARAE